MFRLEKEMIPILRKHLSEKYRISSDFFINEFDSGNGVADLVFTTEQIKKERDSILDYSLFYLIFKYFNRLNKKIEVKELYKNNFVTKKQIENLIDFLIKYKVLEKVGESKFLVKKRYAPPIKEIISIEAKLCDWKGGFYQALRYKTYSHKSYLAISYEFAHRVDLQLLKKHNIGLITVSPDNINIVLKVKNQTPKNSVAQAYLSEKMMCTVFA